MTTPRCAMMLEKISAYLDGDLDASKCAVIEQHCETCDACRAMVAGFRDTMGLCQKAGRMRVPASVRKRARRRVRELLVAQTRMPSSAPRASEASAGAKGEGASAGRTRSRAARSVKTPKALPGRPSRVPAGRRSRRSR
jgi:anti-sigma factor RsiW